MGLFDTVWAKCPKCGEKNEFQSKAGQCRMDEYDLDEAPEDIPSAIAADIAGERTKCPKCRHEWALTIKDKQLLRANKLEKMLVELKPEYIYMVSATRVYNEQLKVLRKGADHSPFYTSAWFYTKEEAEAAIREHPMAVFETGQYNVAVIEEVAYGLTLPIDRKEWWFQRDDNTGDIEEIPKPKGLINVSGFAF